MQITISRQECQKINKVDCENCAMKSDVSLCWQSRTKEPDFCGNFPQCNNGEGCDTCVPFEHWKDKLFGKDF